MDNETVVKVENVSKKYCKSLRKSMIYGAMDIGRNLIGLGSRSDRLRKDEFWALDDISFEVKRGETIGIIGPNGSGKTTLLKLLNGIFWPDKGRITIRGKVGALIEVGAGFHPMLTGRENIYVNAAILGMTKKEVDKKFDEIVEFADIGDFIDTPVKYYSSGMFVRLGFAVAVHCEPDILLVDEVLAVGDILFQVKCFRKIKELKENGKTIILVTHDMNNIQKHTEMVFIINQGSLFSIDKPLSAINKYLALMSEEIKIKKVMKTINFEYSNNHDSNKTEIGGNIIIEDMCPQRANYNKNEFRYGKGFARIVDFKILNIQGEEVTFIKSKEILLFQVKVKGYRTVEKPVLGIIVKTKDGIELYGNNTLYANIEVPPIKKGTQIFVEYRIRFNLQSGDYFVSAGVSEITSEGILPLDRRYDLAHITVLQSDKSYGIVNLDTNIKVYVE